jgi:hypothetical protein
LILISEQLSLAGSGNFGQGNSLFQAEKAGPFRQQRKGPAFEYLLIFP